MCQQSKTDCCQNPKTQRQNLTPEERELLMGQMYLGRKKRQGERNDLKGENIVQISAPSKVRDELAKATGVSTGTVAQFEQVQKKKPRVNYSRPFCFSEKFSEVGFS